MEMIDCVVEILPDNSTIKTYFFDNSSSDGNHLLILTFDQTVQQIIINSGFLDYDHIKIAKGNPDVVSFANCEVESEKIYSFLVEKNQDYVIIDPEHPMHVKPYTLTDDATGEVETFIDIAPGKKYFAFNVKSKNNESVLMLEMGIAYFLGGNMD